MNIYRFACTLACLLPGLSVAADLPPQPPVNPWMVWALPANAASMPAPQPGWGYYVPVQVPAPVTSHAPTPAAFAAPDFSNWSNQPNIMAMMMQMQQPSVPQPPYTMRRIITQEEKKQMVQMVLPLLTGFMRMQMPDVMNFFAHKYAVKAGVSFDDVVESMKLSANKQNLKLVGENLMWKDFRAVLQDDKAPRIEVYSFCDIAVGRELLKTSPEFVIFLPCRIAVMEDANKQIWVLMLDWNPDWVDGYKDQLGLNSPLWEGAIQIRTKLDNVMRAGASGDL